MFCKMQVLFLATIAAVILNVESTREKNKEKKILNCEEATQEKCENSLRWEIQCPKQCDPYPNACHACRDRMYFCDDLTKDSEECDDWEVKGLCLKTCGHCSCDEPTHSEL